MNEQCMFCGKPIVDENKTYEHVIPQWLIKLTGEINRNIMFLPFITDSKPIHIPFKELCFPAHKKCNNEYSRLENKTQIIINKILHSEPVTNIEINTLLKWFDKVRIGLWIGYNSKIPVDKQVKPHFYINQRINKEDRILIIEKTYNTGNRINFCGAESPLFKFMPSAFLLCINDYVFINASAPILCSHNLGFPSFDCFSQDDKGHLQASKVVCPRNKLKVPVIKFLPVNNNSIILYQAIFKELETLKSEYVQDHSINYEAGIGGVFVQHGISTPIYLNFEEVCNITPNTISTNLPEAAINVCKLQNHILLNQNKHFSQTKEQNEQCYNWIGLNNEYIKHLQTTMENFIKSNFFLPFEINH